MKNTPRPDDIDGDADASKYWEHVDIEGLQEQFREREEYRKLLEFETGPIIDGDAWYIQTIEDENE